MREENLLADRGEVYGCELGAEFDGAVLAEVGPGVGGARFRGRGAEGEGAGDVPCFEGACAVEVGGAGDEVFGGPAAPF